jgi:hypothetical protein
MENDYINSVSSKLSGCATSASKARYLNDIFNGETWTQEVLTEKVICAIVHVCHASEIDTCPFQQGLRHCRISRVLPERLASRQMIIIGPGAG